MSKLKKGFQNYPGYSREEKELHCLEYFHMLSLLLREEYTVVSSCNKDNSAYLVPKGTEDQITYHGKPAKSFRISDHWNWKSSLKKNPIEGYVQCYTKDLPSFRNRQAPGKASMPIWAWMVGYYGEDGQYHCVFGERFDRKNKVWDWCCYTDHDDILRMLGKDPKEFWANFMKQEGVA